MATVHWAFVLLAQQLMLVSPSRNLLLLNKTIHMSWMPYCYLLICLKRSKNYRIRSHYELCNIASMPSQFVGWCEDYICDRTQRVGLASSKKDRFLKWRQLFPKAQYLLRSSLWLILYPKLRAPQSHLIKFADDVVLILPLTKTSSVSLVKFQLLCVKGCKMAAINRESRNLKWPSTKVET